MGEGHGAVEEQLKGLVLQGWALMCSLSCYISGNSGFERIMGEGHGTVEEQLKGVVLQALAPICALIC